MNPSATKSKQEINKSTNVQALELDDSYRIARIIDHGIAVESDPPYWAVV
jgi:hypothetical protein